MVRFVITAALAAAALTATSAQAVTIFSDGGTYAETFDSMATTDAAPAGWTFTTGALLTGSGSSTTGGVYSFGATGSSDRALGSLNTNAVVPVITATFTNGSASTISALTIGYNGEIWRFGGSASRGGVSDRLDFAYSVNGGAYTSLDALDLPGYGFTGTVGASALNGNANRSALSATLADLAIAPGQSFTLRWSDVNVAGSDDGLAIDDFALAATFAEPAAVPEPASWAMMVAGFGLMGAAMRKRRPARAFG